MESNSIAPLKGETLYKAALCYKRNLFVFCFLQGFNKRPETCFSHDNVVC